MRLFSRTVCVGVEFVTLDEHDDVRWWIQTILQDDPNPFDVPSVWLTVVKVVA
jgi:hypothetical protein